MNRLYEALQAGRVNPVEARLQEDRLTRLIESFQDDGCPHDGVEECKEPARHLAEEILERYLNWA